jgi:uncharacterized protein (TIGR00369 family)
MPPAPDDFQLHQRHSPATAPWAPLYARIRPGCFEIGLTVAEPHCNARGLLHGGVMAALADNAMGLSLGVALAEAEAGAKPNILTSSLSLDYIASARIGQWVCITPRVLKAGGSSGVVDAVITADGALIARANASFRIKEIPA